MAYKYAYNDEDREKEYKQPKLKTNRSMWKLMLLTILTLGIYNIIFFIPFSFELDKIAPRRDGGKTMNYLFVWLLSIFTLSIFSMIWHYQIVVRIQNALEERNIDYEFGTGDFWGWYFVGSFILIGPFVYFHKLCKAMNLLCESYNENPSVLIK